MEYLYYILGNCLPPAAVLHPVNGRSAASFLLRISSPQGRMILGTHQSQKKLLSPVWSHVSDLVVEKALGSWVHTTCGRFKAA